MPEGVASGNVTGQLHVVESCSEGVTGERERHEQQLHVINVSKLIGVDQAPKVPKPSTSVMEVGPLR